MWRRVGFIFSGLGLIAVFSSVNSFAAPVQLPFSEDFESGRLASHWTRSGTADSRVQVTNTQNSHGGAYHLLMDTSATNGGYSRCELTLNLNVGGYTNAVLRLWVKGFNEEVHGPPGSPFTSANFDGVAISTNGTTWQEVLTFTNLSSNYTQVIAPLDPPLRARNWRYGTNMFIRFYQFDNQPIPNDGIALDDISITANLPPIAQNGTITMDEDTPIAIELPGSDPDATPLTGTIVSLPASGKLFQVTNGVASAPITNAPTVLTNGRSVIYLPSTNRFGTNIATFQFRLSDGGASSSNAVLTIDVLARNDPPSAEDDVVSTLPGQTVTFDPLANDWDRDGDPIELAWFYPSSRGALVQNTDGVFTYTPNADFQHGSDQFEYVIFDPSGLIATGTVTIMVGALQGGDWTTFANGPAHTGYYPGKLSNQRFVPTWNIPYTNSGVLGISEVVIAQGLAIFQENYQITPPEGGANHLIAVDVDNGRQVWSRDFPIRYFYPPTYDRGRIYIVQDTPHTLWCISAQTGEVIWTSVLSSTPAGNFAPTVAADGVWFRTGAGHQVAGFDTNGNMRFEVYAGGYQYDPYWTCSYYQDVVYAYDLATLTALHPVTGETNWQMLVHEYPPSFVSVAPAIAEGRAFLNARERFSAVDLQTRALAWTNTGGFIGTPAVHKGITYITSTNGVQAYRASDGALIREYLTGSDELFVYTSGSICPIVTDDVLITSRGTNTYVFDLETSTELQRIPYSGYPALANGTLLLASGDVKLRAFVLPMPSDLTVTATAPGKAPVWNPFDQVYTVRNSGPMPASGARLVYHIPPSANFVSAVPSQGACSKSGDQVICDLGSLAADDSATVAFQVVPTTTGWFASQANVFRGEADANADNNLGGTATEIELPRLSVTNLAFLEGNSGITIASPRVSLSTTSAVPVRMDFEFSPASARAGADFLVATGSVVFQPGERERIVNVSIVGDMDYEEDEMFYFTLVNITNAAGPYYFTTCTILNDDPPPVVSIFNISVSERNVGQRAAFFTLSLSKTSSLPASVYVETTNITAEAGSDYGAIGGWVGFSLGETLQTIAVPIYGDVLVEPNETFALVLRNPYNLSLARTSAVCTIIDDDSFVGQIHHFRFESLPNGVVPNKPFPTVLGALDAYDNPVPGFNGLVTLRALLRDTSVLIGQGETNEFSPLPFAPLHENYAGYLHCELLYLASELKGPRRLTGLEFPGPPASVLPNNLTIRLQHTSQEEYLFPIWSASGATTVFATNNNYSSPATIQFQTPFDYNGIDNLLIEFDWKADFHWASVRPGHDTRHLRALFWSSTASYPGVPVGQPRATSILPTIRLHGATANTLEPNRLQLVNGAWSGNLMTPDKMDGFVLQADDGDGHIGISPPLTGEALNELWMRIHPPENITIGVPFVYTISLSNSGPATSRGVRVTNYVSGAEITSVVSSRGGWSWSADGLEAAVGDVTPGVIETIRVQATPSSPYGVSILGLVFRTEPEEWYYPRFGGTTDILPIPRVSIRSGASGVEGSTPTLGTIPFTAVLSMPSTAGVSVDWYTEDITAISDQNNSKKDYSAGYGIVTFGAGETNKTFTVNTWPDLDIESDETFRAHFRYAINAVIEPGRDSAIGTILNDDLPQLSATGTTVIEGDEGVTNANFLVTLSQPAPFLATMSFVTASDTATGGDFLGTNGQVTFQPGETSKVVSIPVFGDLLNEPDERFIFQFIWGTNIAFTNGQVYGVIVDNDPLPTITPSSAGAVEGNRGYTNLTFSLNLSVPSGRGVDVSYVTSNYTALAGSDFLSVTGRAHIFPGKTNAMISVPTIPIIGDTEIEPDERFYLVLSNPSNAVLSTNIAVGTILNDDGLPGKVQFLSFSAIPSPKFAGQPFPVTISARDVTGAPVSNFTGPVNLRLPDRPPLGTNLDFEAPVLAPWYPAGHVLTNFDVNGDGTSSRAVQFPLQSFFSAGICQFVPLKGGASYSFRVSCAVTNPGTLDDTRASRVALIVSSNVTIASIDIPPLLARETRRFELRGDYAPLIDGSNSLCIRFSTLSTGNYTMLAYVDDVLIQSNPPELSPTVTGVFTDGVWSGEITIGNAGAQMQIEADDNDNHFGRSNPFDVNGYNDLWAVFAPVPAIVPVDQTITYALAVSNSGPAIASDVVVTNVLAPSADLLGLYTTKGTYTFAPGEIRFTLGALAAGEQANIVIQVTASVGAGLTNLAFVSSALAESNTANNRAAVITRTVVPSVSIFDATVTEGHIGTTNAVFRVTLSAPRTRDVWVQYYTPLYASYPYTATPGKDFLGTNWLVHFPPGSTNQVISVPVLGDVEVESTETFTLVLNGYKDVLVGRSQAIGTIIDDDSGPGLVFANAQFSDAPQGNGNGVSEPGEIVRLNIILRNTLANVQTMSNITSTLYCTTPGVSLLNSNSAYPNITAGAFGTNLTPFVFHIPKNIPCGAIIEFIHIAEGEYRSDILIRRQYASRLTNTVRAPTWIIDRDIDTNAAGITLSLALDSNQRPHVAFDAASVRDLRYVYHDGTRWITQVLPAISTLQPEVSLALSSSDLGRIAFRDPSLKFAAWDGANWQIETIVSDDVRSQPSLALDASGTPLVAAQTPNQFALMFYFKTNGVWAAETIETNSFYLIGRTKALAVDANGVASVAYSFANNRIRFAMRRAPGTWAGRDIDSGAFSGTISLALDTNGAPHISYLDDASQMVKYATSNSYGWSVEQVARRSRSYTSIRVDKTGRPIIAYYDYAVSSLVKLAVKAGGVWSFQNVDSSGSGALALALENGLTPAVSFLGGRLNYARMTGCGGFNNAPVAYNRTFEIGSGAPHDLLLSAYDVDDDPLSFEILSNAPNAQISNFDPARGTLSYQAPDLFEGIQTLAFRAFDGAVCSGPGMVTISVFSDTDHDSLPDAWESAHGLNPADPTDAALDTDGDGASNLQEYLAGTLPNDRSSCLRLSLARAGNVATLEFQAQSNKTYSIEFTDSPGSPVWTVLSRVAAESATRKVTVTDSNVTAARFYRAIVLSSQ